jgi:hypothetical protein
VSETYHNEDLRERVAELEERDQRRQEELEKLAETLGHDEPTEEAERAISRRDVLAGGGAVMGLGGLLAGATGSAEADALGNVGTQPDPVTKLWAHELGAGDGASQITVPDNVRLARQNDNAVNLTRLVNNGTYSDIGDAIANEPANNAAGTVHVIEPGTYTVSSTYRITYDNAVIRVAGGSRGRTFNASASPTAVTIEAATSRLFNVADKANDTDCRGVSFEGITFRPDSANSRSEAFFFDVDSSGFAQEVEFHDCQFREWGGPGIDVANQLWWFGGAHYGCAFDRPQDTMVFGNQQSFFDCRFTADDQTSGAVGFELGAPASVFGGEVVVGSNGQTGLKVGGNSVIMPNNVEGDGSAGSVGIEVNGTAGDPTAVATYIHDWETGVYSSQGSIHGFNSFVSISGDLYDLDGGNNDHNGTFLYGDLPPASVRVASDTNLLTIKDAKPRNGLTKSNIPAGYEGYDTSPGYTTNNNPALIYGPNSYLNPAVRVVEFTETV